jgi:hypothetical protein
VILLSFQAALHPHEQIPPQNLHSTDRSNSICQKQPHHWLISYCICAIILSRCCLFFQMQCCTRINQGLRIIFDTVNEANAQI